MYEIRIPERLYKEATRAAGTQHLSVEEFVLQAVQIRVMEASEEPLRLTPDQIAKVQAGLDQAQRGETLTLEEVKNNLEAQKVAYFAAQATKQSKK